jgi:hypothetical protein
VLILIFAATAFAATFSDVPPGHWAYDAVQKLASADLIAGAGDGTFRGDRSLSRYEFAILTAKAIDSFDRANDEQKKLIDKLTAEFAGELNRMGVRVAKVETKTNTWVVGMDMRFRYHTDDPQTPGTPKLRGSDQSDWRGRISLKGAINENWTVNARLTTNWSNRFGNMETQPQGSTTYVDVFNVKGNHVLGFDSAEIGRDGVLPLGYGILSRSDSADGLWLNKALASNVAFSFWTGNVSSDANYGTGVGDSGKANQLTTGNVFWNINENSTVGAGYYWSSIPGTSTANTVGGSLMDDNGAKFDDSRGYDLSIRQKVAGLTFLGEYIGTTLKNPSNMPGSPRGWSVQLSNGKGPEATMYFFNNTPMTDRSKVGDSAWLINYRHIESGTTPHGASGFDALAASYVPQPFSVYAHGNDNVKGFIYSYEYVPAKNITLNIAYQDLKIVNRALTDLTSDGLNRTLSVILAYWF